MVSAAEYGISNYTFEFPCFFKHYWRPLVCYALSPCAVLVLLFHSFQLRLVRHTIDQQRKHITCENAHVHDIKSVRADPRIALSLGQSR